MSEQTKNQSIGYTLKAMLDAGSSSNELKAVFYLLKEKIADDATLNNHATSDLMVRTLREEEKDEKYIGNVGGCLYYAYDMYTVEEAKEFYHAFLFILRVRG